MTEIQRVVSRLVKAHKGLRKASRAIGIDAPYLSRLRSGIKSNPSAGVLEKLGITRHVVYRRAKTSD